MTDDLLISEVKIANQTVGNIDVYLVNCTEKCKSVHITLDEERGDADLIVHQNEIRGTPGERSCPICNLCESAKAGGEEYCKISSVEDHFYVSVKAYSDYNNATLTLRGSNLDQVNLLEPTTTTSTTTTTTPNPSTQREATSTGST